jgi:protein-S-isoprenylcysteine O-methyltransferase Ste14
MGLLVRLALFIGMLAGALFLSAGRADLPFVWALLATYVVFGCLAGVKMDPALRQERFRPAPGGTDRALRWLIAPFLVAIWVVAGLDLGRFHWSDTVPVAVQGGALAVFTAALLLSGWAMSVNRFFSPVVRIQTERGHHLVTAGPYRFIRHPGYLGSVLAFLCGTLALGSWWAMVPAVAGAGLMLRRTAIEDRFLKENLEGYAAFAGKVRYRLLPGVW